MGHVLHCGDCREVLQSIPSKSVDVVITSPPYNIGVGYDSHYDKKTKLDYQFFLQDCFEEIQRILKDSGSFFYNVASKVSEQEQMTIHWNLCSEYFSIQNTILWVKSIFISPILTGSETITLEKLLDRKDINSVVSRLKEGKTFGHNKPINSKRFLNNQFEFIFHLTKEKEVQMDKLAVGVPYTYKSEIKRRGKSVDIKDRGNVWFIPYETRQKSKGHPATFPPQLPEMCIKLHGLATELVVLDPFCGEGNTGIACQNIGVENFIGIDISHNYIAMAAENMKLSSF